MSTAATPTAAAAVTPTTDHWLNKAGRAALRAIIPALLTLAYGLSTAKDLTGIKLQATVGLIAIATAAFGAIQAFVPFLSWRKYAPEWIAKYLDAFTQTFVGTFITLIVGWLGAPNFHFGTTLLIGIVTGALAAAVRAVQAMVTKGEPVFKGAPA